MRIVTADGRQVERAYANAHAGDAELEGIRVEVTPGANGPRCTVVADDAPAAARWEEDRIETALRTMETLAASGDLDMCDEDGVDAWIA